MPGRIIIPFEAYTVYYTFLDAGVANTNYSGSVTSFTNTTFEAHKSGSTSSIRDFSTVYYVTAPLLSGSINGSLVTPVDATINELDIFITETKTVIEPAIIAEALLTGQTQAEAEAAAEGDVKDDTPLQSSSA